MSSTASGSGEGATTSAGPDAATTTAPGAPTTSPQGSSIPSSTTPIGPLVASSPTTTLVGSPSAPSATSATASPRLTTTTAGDGPLACTASRLADAWGRSQPLPAGAKVVGFTCTGLYASATFAIPKHQDTFVVYASSSSGWEVLNAGTSFVCQSLDIPDPDYTSLGCHKWDQ